MKFYPSDWRADPALRMCSIGARGLWMEMLCVMHEAAPRGSLLVNGAPVSDKQLAGLAGISLRDCVAFLSELGAAGVFSREDGGSIFSRRMRRDEERAERDKANGRQGGNPTLKMGVNPPDKAQIPDTRVQKESIPSVARGATVEAVKSLFDEFWQEYPRRLGSNPKEPAMRSFLRLIALGKKHEFDEPLARAIIAGAKRYAAELREQGKINTPYVARASTFLSEKRWQDYPEKAAAEPALADGKFYARPESGEIAAWDRYYLASRGRGLPRDKAGGWIVPAQWPPDHPASIDPPIPVNSVGNSGQGGALFGSGESGALP